MSQSAQPEFDDSVVLELLDRLGPEDDEVAVLSALYDRDEGDLVLRHAKLLFGPAAIGESSWAKWHYDEQVRPLAGDPAAMDLPPNWLCDHGDFVAGRAVLSRDEARAWLQQLASDRLLPRAGVLPSARAGLAVPKAFLRVFPNLDTPLSPAAVMSRPLQGFFFEAEPRPDRDFPDTWTIEGVGIFGAPLTALGIGVRMASNVVAHPPPVGLLVARMERCAWLIDARGSGDYENFDLHIGWDPARCDLADLEVEFEEWEADELAYSRRLDLGEIELPGRESGNRGVLSLPTLGQRLRHAARLHDRDGTLLDMTAPHWLVEQMHFTLEVGVEGSDQKSKTTTKLGEPYSPTARERIERFDRAEREYREWLERGLAGRIIRDPASALTFVKNELKLARGELLVLDPYFGADVADWEVLRAASVPVRVLTGAKANPPVAPLPNVDARRFKFKKAPGFHDRLYLWEGGGLSVGTSPSGLGKRDARVDRLGTVEADGWRALFETYWQSDDYVPL